MYTQRVQIQQTVIVKDPRFFFAIALGNQLSMVSDTMRKPQNRLHVSFSCSTHNTEHLPMK
jgi:hypothetical protein